MKLDVAMSLAKPIAKALRPFCADLLLVGSLRRKEPEVNDIEFCVRSYPLLVTEFVTLVNGWDRLKGDAKGRYTRRRVPSCPLEVDIFICSEATWGCNCLIRTGCADFSQTVVTRARKMGWAFSDARLWDHNSQIVSTPTEREVFTQLGLPYYAPRQRTQQTARDIRRISLPRTGEASPELSLFGGEQ